jgi:H+/Cl- antiporter ClcA
MGALISVLVFALIIAIVWWALQQLSLPQPIRMVVVVIIALIAILWLVQFLGVGPSFHLR